MNWLRRLLGLKPRQPKPPRFVWICESCGSRCPVEDEDDCRFCFARRPAICEYRRIR